MTETNCFVNNLLEVAKELKKAEHVKKFKKEFEREMSEQMEVDTCPEHKPQKDDISNNETEYLKMEVFEDKDYDIEEVKFWNFISKNKGIKPSIIRTVVYKYPETSYVVKKIPVYLPKPEKTPSLKVSNNDSLANNENKQIQENTSSVQASTETQAETNQKKVGRPKGSSIQIKSVKKLETPTEPPTKPEISNPLPKIEKKAAEIIPINKSEQLNELLKSTKASTIDDSTKKQLAASTSTHFISKNYKMEDLIMIDEDDDIIGYNESDEEHDLEEARLINQEENNLIDEQESSKIQASSDQKECQGIENNESTQETYEIDLTYIDDINEETEERDKIEENIKINEIQEEKLNPLLTRKKRSKRSSFAKEKNENSDTNSETHSNSSKEQKTKSASDSQVSIHSNKRKSSKVNQSDCINKIEKQIESPVGSDQVTRVTRSKSKIGQNQGVSSPASSTSSNK